MKKIIIWTLVKRKVADLIPAEYNPRKLSDKARADLLASVSEFGKVEPLVINTDNTVVGGHQRLTIYADLKTEEVDVMIPDRKLSKSEEKALNIRLNKNVGEWDGEKLKKFFGLDELTAAGFEEAEAKAFFGLSDANDVNVDEERMQILTVQPPESPSLKERVGIRFKNKAEYDRVKEFLKGKGGVDAAVLMLIKLAK